MMPRKIIHPRKLTRIISEFVNQAHQPTYTAIRIPPLEDGQEETTEQFIDRLHNAEEIECPAYFKVMRDKSFLAYTCDDGEDILRIGYNIDELYGKGSKQFREMFVDRYPSAKGFADITISILHEVGHFASEQEFENYDRDEMLKLIHKNFPAELVNFAYFCLPDEENATTWAIEWLQQKENRAIAKAFEKKFFSCFE